MLVSPLTLKWSVGLQLHACHSVSLSVSPLPLLACMCNVCLHPACHLVGLPVSCALSVQCLPIFVCHCQSFCVSFLFQYYLVCVVHCLVLVCQSVSLPDSHLDVFPSVYCLALVGLPISPLNLSVQSLPTFLCHSFSRSAGPFPSSGSANLSSATCLCCICLYIIFVSLSVNYSLSACLSPPTARLTSMTLTMNPDPHDY